MLKEKISHSYLHVAARNIKKKLVWKNIDSVKEEFGKDVKEVVNPCEANCRYRISGNFVYLTKYLCPLVGKKVQKNIIQGVKVEWR